MPDRKVAAVRPDGCGAGFGIAQACGRQSGPQPVFGVEGGHGGNPAVDLAGHGEGGAGEGADAESRSSIEPLNRIGPIGGQRHAMAGHGVFQRGEPVGVAVAFAQQPRTLA